MAYALGAVKPHVKSAANHFGPKHGYSVVYGWRVSGSVSGSDHPKGLALDFMGSNRAKGDALVSDVIANAGAWNVTYVIWQRRIWTRESGSWKSYSGPSPHTNHVHVSFGDASGTGIAVTPVGGNPLIPDWVEGLKATFDKVESIFNWLTHPGNWKRIIIFGVGASLIVISLQSVIIKSVGKVVK